MIRGVLRLLSACLSLVACAGSLTPSDIEGAWMSTGIKWTNAPEAVEPGLRTGEAAVLYFGPGRSFTLIYCVIYHSGERYAISAGDGQVVYTGSWRPGAAEGTIEVEFRLVSRTVAVFGEILPGKVERAIIMTTPQRFEFRSGGFVRFRPLDNDARKVSFANRPRDAAARDPRR